MARTKKIKVHGVSIDLDETQTHWLVYVSPGNELQAQGINPLRATRAKCVCNTGTRLPWLTVGGVCKYEDCKGWTVLAAANYVAKLLRAYPKVTVEVPAERPKPRRQQMPKALRWHPVRKTWVAL